MGTEFLSHAPLVSFIVPAWNAGRHIRATLDSLVAQNYRPLEIVVVDDGSSDNTWEVVQEMARLHPEIRASQQRNSGVAAARNAGVAMARGDFLAPVDADDLWLPRAAEQLARCLHSAPPHVGVAYAWSVTIDDDGVLDGGFRCSMIQGHVLRTLLCHNFIGNASATMVRRTYFDQAGGYDPSFREHNAQGCED